MISASGGRRGVGTWGVLIRVLCGETTLWVGWIIVIGRREDGPGDVYRPGLAGSRSVIGLDGRVGRVLGMVCVGSGSGSGGLRISCL